MKKRSKKKLSLNKFTISRLTNLNPVFGGNDEDPEPGTGTITKTTTTQKPPTDPTEPPVTEPPKE